jgi:hypothetical protein
MGILIVVLAGKDKPSGTTTTQPRCLIGDFIATTLDQPAASARYTSKIGAPAASVQMYGSKGI